MPNIQELNFVKGMQNLFKDENFLFFMQKWGTKTLEEWILENSETLEEADSVIKQIKKDQTNA